MTSLDGVIEKILEIEDLSGNRPTSSQLRERGLWLAELERRVGSSSRAQQALQRARKSQAVA